MRNSKYEFLLIWTTPWRFEEKLYVEKVNPLISYENNERTNFFSTQARSETFSILESSCYEEL